MKVLIKSSLMMIALASGLSAPGLTSEALALDPVSTAISAPTFANARKLDDLDTEEPFRFGLGFSSYGTFSSKGFPGALSANFDLNNTHSIQVFFGITSVKDSFNYGTGAAYRATLSGDRNIGFHIGALANYGGDSDTRTIAQMGPIVGFHVAAFQFHQLQILVDGGPMFQYRKRPDLNVSPIGGKLGLSVHYFF